MSVQAMQWVIEHSQHKGSDLLVLLMVANHAGSEGWECWPSVELLAQECRLSERNIQYILRRLEKAGELAVKHGGGPRGTHLYRLLEVQPIAGRKVFRGATQRQKEVQPAAPRGRNPLHPNHKEPSLEPSSISFDDWYSNFPRHEGKGAAKKAWAKAISKAPPEDLIDAAVRYRNDPNRDPAYTCLPATWLNQERWEDEALPSRNGEKPAPVAPRSRRISEYTDEELEALRV
jgi:hypothetical protein